MCIMKIIKKKIEYQKNNETKTAYNYYVVTDNDNYIAVKPVFKNDYSKLFIISDNAEK